MRASVTSLGEMRDGAFEFPAARRSAFGLPSRRNSLVFPLRGDSNAKASGRVLILSRDKKRSSTPRRGMKNE